MAAEPEIDTRDALDTRIGALTVGTNLFDGKMREIGPYIPAEAVFCQITEGSRPEPFAGGTSYQQHPSVVKVMVRSEPDDLSGSRTLARSIQTALDKVDLTGYIEVRALQSDPYYIGEDAKRHHYWELNFELIHDR
jgi:hypothetical protein